MSAQIDEVKVWYDKDLDTMHVRWSDGEGYYATTADDRVLERVDDSGKSLGFMIEGVSSVNRDQPARVTLGVNATDDVKNVTVEEAARRLGLSVRRVRRLCAEGRVEGATRLGRDWIIPTPVQVSPGSRGPKGAARLAGEKVASGR